MTSITQNIDRDRKRESKADGKNNLVQLTINLKN